MDESIIDHNSLWDWFIDMKDKKSLVAKIVYFIAMLYSFFSSCIKIYDFTKLKNEGGVLVTLTSIGINIIVLIGALILINRNYFVDKDATKKKLQECQSTESLAIYSNINDYDEDHSRAKDLLDRFRNFFSYFLWATIGLYCVLFFAIGIKAYDKGINRFSVNASTYNDSIIKDRLHFQGKQLLSIALLNSKDTTLYSDTINKKFSNTVIAVENIYSYTYDNNYIKDITEIAITFINNIGVGFLYACFLLFFRNSPSIKSRERQTKTYIIITIIFMYTLLHLGVRVFASDLGIQNLIKIHRVFKVGSGLANAIVMSLFFSKFNSRHFKPTIFIMIVFFSYAACQTLFCMFDYIILGRKFLIMEITIFICLFGKCLLILYLYWLLKSNKLYFYFLTYPKTITFIDTNWEQIKRKLVIERD